MCPEMGFETKRGVIIHTFVCSMFSVFMVGHGVVSDIFCLRSIKESLEDPFNYLNWNFNNNTEGFICHFIGVECWHPDENRVLIIKLSNMGLKGQFPRGIQNCSSLTGLDLSLNDLTGPIPSDISELLTFATSIDLSNNKFNGEIPVSLANCTYMNTLKLDSNMLSGQIPQEFGLLPRLNSISFTNNHLSGPVPKFFNSSADIFANNDGLCGGPLPACSFNNSTEFRRSFRNGLFVGYAISVISVIVVYGYMPYSCWTVCPQLKQEKDNNPNKAKELGKYICSITSRKTRRLANWMRQYLSLQLAERKNDEISKFLERLTSTLSLEELRDASDCFAIDNAIGMGKMGIVYEGRLPNGQLLAIKRPFDSQLFERHFLLEIMVLSKYKHTNIVPLFGFCNEGKEKILAYQYMSNGRLSKWLNPLESDFVRLKWPQRFNIALGMARGLAWLHHGCDLHIVHLNLCSQCILLDDNFEPKISNFGEAKFMNPNTWNDVCMVFKVSDGKKDVYDFGSIVFELITGKSYNELSLSLSITNLCVNPSNFYDAIDKSLFGKGVENEVCGLLKVACECVQDLPDRRPTMLEVFNNVSNMRKGQRGSSDDSDPPRGSEIVSVASRDEIIEL